MIMQDFVPPPSSREFVRAYRLVHFKFHSDSSSAVKAYAPRPENCLGFYPFDLETAEYPQIGKVITPQRVSLTGQQLCTTNRHHHGKEFLTAQIIFQPAALFRLTGIPAHALNDQYLGADQIFSSDVHFVNEQLFHATSYPQMLKILDGFVHSLKVARKPRSRNIENAGTIMLNTDGTVSLDWLATQVCLSTKQFERNFKEQIGVSPKLYARVIRFDKAFRTKARCPELDWLSIAIQCGYYDYQHLGKDYKDFTSYSPTVFHQLDQKGPEHELGIIGDYYSSCVT